MIVVHGYVEVLDSVMRLIGFISLFTEVISASSASIGLIVLHLLSLNE